MSIQRKLGSTSKTILMIFFLWLFSLFLNFLVISAQAVEADSGAALGSPDGESILSATLVTLLTLPVVAFLAALAGIISKLGTDIASLSKETRGTGFYDFSGNRLDEAEIVTELTYRLCKFLGIFGAGGLFLLGLGWLSLG